MRIIAGRFGSRRIVAPEGPDTRPTLDMTRESLFNMLQGSVQGARVLDLFAGSGALGLEALSRGAEFAVFCDASGEAVRAVKRNLESLGAQDEARVLKGDYAVLLERLGAAGERFDLVFIDPPYAAQTEPILRQTLRSGVMAEQGLIVYERDAHRELVLPDGLALRRSRVYGRTALDFIGHSQGEQT